MSHSLLAAVMVTLDGYRSVAIIISRAAMHRAARLFPASKGVEFVRDQA
jgi:hypothetical protein